MIAWLSSWLASRATEELVSTAPDSAKPTATRAATMCRARTAAKKKIFGSVFKYFFVVVEKYSYNYDIIKMIII